MEMPGCVDDENLKLSDIDFEVIATKAGKPPTSALNPARDLVRHNMLEVITRTAYTKYAKPKIAADYAEAVDMLLAEHLREHINKFDTHAWRVKYLWTEENDLALKMGLETLRNAYKAYYGGDAQPGGKKYLSCREFEDMIVTANVFSQHFGQREVT